MKSEMDLMKMDERQRQAWFRANRILFMTVGVVWLGMIGWELAHGETPLFLIVMVPLFAALRFVLYRSFLRSP